MNDTQANLKPIAACAIGHVIASLDPEQGCKYLKSIAGGLIAGLADNKKGMRDSTVSALQVHGPPAASYWCFFSISFHVVFSSPNSSSILFLPEDGRDSQ